MKRMNEKTEKIKPTDFEKITGRKNESAKTQEDVRMKKIFTWIWMFQKRILKKPMFQITLLLIPVLLFLLFSFNKSSDSLVRVAVCPGNNEYNEDFAQELLDSSNQVISYYICDDEEQLRKDVIKGRAECGYIFPSDMQNRIAEYEKNSKQAIVTAVIKEESISTKVVNEIIYGRLFKETAYHVLENFMNEKQPDKMSASGENEKMQEYFEDYRQEQLMFSFEYADGRKNELLNSDNNNYYMLPVRGLLSVLIMVAAMGGILMLADDERKGTWNLIRLSNRPVFNYFYILMTVLPVAVCSLVAVFFTGVSTGILNEILLMILYILLVTGFCNLLKALVRNIYVLCSLIPIGVLLSLIICPVFIDMGSLVPQIKIVRLFLPPNYYLDAIYSSSMQLKMGIVAIVVSVLGVVADKRGLLHYR